MTLIKRSGNTLLPAMGLAILLNSPYGWADSVTGENGTIEITPLVHSSVQLEYNGFVVQVDPWAAVDISHAEIADLILVTDSPGHHLDAEAIANLSDADTSVVIAENGRSQIPEGIVAINGELLMVSGVTVEAVAAYDIILGPPEHPKGDANGYVLSLGGKKFFFAGVTECVDEVKALEGIDVAFMPMNIPVGRMTPKAAADCTKILDPDVVYTYHYDQDWVRRLANPDFGGSTLPGGLSIPETLDAFEKELTGSGIEFRRGNWYPD
ncbi:MAG: MBL fold metallo-hydrolase [Gammaproteobacteria bacterium]|nr:MBL fold metallo-hydrolase [Gammaproteobacteria bacterium]MDD9959223.1 MBL fold metallo-hydrolase [Gammaproteobacteria bacterium]